MHIFLHGRRDCNGHPGKPPQTNTGGPMISASNEPADFYHVEHVPFPLVDRRVVVLILGIHAHCLSLLGGLGARPAFWSMLITSRHHQLVEGGSGRVHLVIVRPDREPSQFVDWYSLTHGLPFTHETLPTCSCDAKASAR